MDIILINPATQEAGYQTEHLGILSLKAFVNSRNYQADVLDMAIENLTINETIEKILDINPKMVGVSLLDTTQKNGFEIIRGLKNSGYNGLIVIGGYFATFSSREILKDFPEIDFVVRGEGELTLVELLDNIINESEQFDQVLGLSYRRRNVIKENPSRPLIKDLDILPAPDRKYASLLLKNKTPLRIYGTRGCWGHCSFCDIVGFYRTSPGKKWRRRSAEHLVDEIDSLVKQFKTNYFIFNDDQFLIKGKSGLELVREFVKELKKRQLGVEFELMCRADSVNKKVISLLKSVGLKRVFLGLESFDKNQLERYGKNVSVRQNLKAIITLYKLKIDVIASVILADAFTTFSDILKQFIFLFILKQRYFNSPNCKISVNKKLEIHRGSRVYEEYKIKNLLSKDNYLHGYDFKLKFWTHVRIQLFSWEENISYYFKKLVEFISKIKNMRWQFS